MQQLKNILPFLIKTHLYIVYRVSVFFPNTTSDTYKHFYGSVFITCITYFFNLLTICWYFKLKGDIIWIIISIPILYIAIKTPSKKNEHLFNLLKKTYFHKPPLYLRLISTTVLINLGIGIYTLFCH
jgi:hypothetical protein